MKKWLKRMAIIVIVLWLAGVCGLIVWIYQAGNTDTGETADVLVVLGAAVRRDGRADLSLTRRSQHAADLWHAGRAPEIVCTGAQAQNRPNSEAEACREILLEQGVSPDVIRMETRSRSTEENAIYTRELMQAEGWQRALVVSDSYHMLRAGFIFRSQGIETVLSPVPSERIHSRSFYVWSVMREVAALHWQVFKQVFNLPVTNIPLV